MKRGRLVQRPAHRAAPLRGEALPRGLKVGLFGGSFDPPHAGHRHAAETAMRRLGLDRVWWLVSPQNPLKSRRAGDLAARRAAVERYADRPGMVVSDIETRMGTSRTIELLKLLRRQHPGVHFVWIMGADNLASIHRWADWRQIFQTVTIAVIARPQDAIRARLSPAAELYRRSRLLEGKARALPLHEPPGWTYLVERLHSHSSTALRARH